MIGLTFITQFVYWYRDLKTPGLAESERRQAVKIEVKQTAESNYLNTSVDDYLTPYEQPWTDVGNLEWKVYDRKFEFQEKLDLKSNDVGSGFQERLKTNFNESALVNSELVEYNPYIGGVRYSECSKWNVTDSPLENPDRMEWNSFEGGVIFLERPECIKNELSTTERSKVFTEPISGITNPQKDNDSKRRRQWEQNEMDYMGQDSFQNILSKLERTLNN